MNNEYNLSILEALFADHLNAENISAVSRKNYRSDIKYFLNWLYIYLKPHSLVSSEGVPMNSYIELFITHASAQLIEQFKEYLVNGQIPLKTINRRLSAVRRFFRFCVHRGILGSNPAVGVQNYKIAKPMSVIAHEPNAKSEINEFEEYLSSRLNSDNADKIMADYEEFKKLWF